MDSADGVLGGLGRDWSDDDPRVSLRSCGCGWGDPPADRQRICANHRLARDLPPAMVPAAEQHPEMVAGRDLLHGARIAGSAHSARRDVGRYCTSRRRRNRRAEAHDGAVFRIGSLERALLRLSPVRGPACLGNAGRACRVGRP